VIFESYVHYLQNGSTCYYSGSRQVNFWWRTD